MRILLISLASVFVVFILVLMTRLWGQGVQYSEFQHPFFESTSTPLVVLKASSKASITAALKKKSDLVFWLDVKTTSDKKLIVFFKELSDKDMSVEAYRGPQSFAYSFQQLANQNREIQLLKDIVAGFPQQKFILNIQDNVDDVHTLTVETLKGLQPEKRIILQSNYNVVMESIKKLEPFWLYGSSQADLMRFLTFDSMWILPSTPFKGDVYIAPFKLLNRPAFQESTLQELRRRKKKIILGPVLNKSEFDDAVRLSVDGLIIVELADYLSWARP